MNFEPLSIWIIVTVIVIAIIGFAVYRLKKGESMKRGDAGKQFFAMGIIWVITGLVYGIWRDTNLFDIGIFNLGLIFTLAGGAQLAVNRYKNKQA